MSRRRVVTLSVSVATAMAVAMLAAPLNAAPGRADEGSQECNSRLSVIVMGRNCDRSERAGPASSGGSGGPPTSQPRPNVESQNLPVRLPAGGKQFTGWVSVEDGLLNLSHVQRITLVSADDKTFLVMAQLGGNNNNEKVTLVSTDKREVAEKALRSLAAKVRAISAVRG
ncbi:MAG: hypothetical protein ACRDJG_05935 [Actinomycetota bacterium]